jgi:hypothetical protein
LARRGVSSLSVEVKLGIRAQLLMAMAALLVLAFAPLFFAISSLARASFTQSWDRSARSLGRAIAGHVSEARKVRPEHELRSLLEAQLGEDVGAIALYDPAGALSLGVGVGGLPDAVEPAREVVRHTTSERGIAMVVVIPSEHGAVAALLHTDPSAVRVAPLVQLVALYIGLLGLALLVFSYFVLTRIVVTPVEGLGVAGTYPTNITRRAARVRRS